MRDNDYPDTPDVEVTPDAVEAARRVVIANNHPVHINGILAALGMNQ